MDRALSRQNRQRIITSTKGLWGRDLSIKVFLLQFQFHYDEAAPFSPSFRHRERFVIKQHCELSTMFAFCCTVSSKILFYLILICYHMVDIVFDWKTFAALLRDNKFSGVSISKSEESMIQILFGLSCVTGTIFSVAMIVAYKNYIKHHWHCMNNASFDLVSHYSNGNVWFSPDIRGDKKCDRKLVSFELWISVLELFLKDIIQSGILFWATQSSGTSNPDSMSIVFSVCSIVAHLVVGLA